MKERIESTKKNFEFQKDQKIFQDYYSKGRIEEIDLTEIPEEAMRYPEQKSRQWTPETYKPGNFEKSYIVRHDNNDITYIIQQTVTYEGGGSHGCTDQLTYFVDMRGDDVVGRSELLNNKSAPEKNKGYEKMFKDRPSAVNISTVKGF